MLQDFKHPNKMFLIQRAKKLSEFGKKELSENFKDVD